MLTRRTAQTQKLWVQRHELFSRHGVVLSRHSRFSFFVLSLLRGFVPRRRAARLKLASEKKHSGGHKGKRTTLRKHIFNSCLSLLQPPVHLRHLSAWQASRARKNSLQATCLTVRSEEFEGVKFEHTEPVGFLRMHLQSGMDNASRLLRRSRENLNGDSRESIDLINLRVVNPA